MCNLYGWARDVVVEGLVMILFGVGGNILEKYEAFINVFTCSCWDDGFICHGELFLDQVITENVKRKLHKDVRRRSTHSCPRLLLLYNRAQRVRCITNYRSKEQLLNFKSVERYWNLKRMFTQRLVIHCIISTDHDKSSTADFIDEFCITEIN